MAETGMSAAGLVVYVVFMPFAIAWLPADHAPLWVPLFIGSLIGWVVAWFWAAVLRWRRG